VICEKIMSELNLANLLRYYSIFLSELWFIKKMPSYSKFDILQYFSYRRQSRLIIRIREV
jgi:hypothetical protein